MLDRLSPWRGVALAGAVVVCGGCNNDADPAQILANGYVEATEVRLSTKVGGLLKSFPVGEGDSVAQGQELARIDDTDLILALRQAEAEHDHVTARLRLALAGARQEDVAAAEAQVRAAEAEDAAARRDLERMQGLFDRGSGTGKGRDDAASRRDAAAARLVVAREHLARLRAGTRAEEKDAVRARVEVAAARVAQIEQQLTDATLVSPVSGVVTEKLAERGELLRPGSAVCVVTDLDNAWLTVYVSGPDVARVRLGGQAEVTTDDGQRRPGRVTYVASRAEFTPKNVQTRDERVKLVFKVKLGLDNTDGLFKPGMPAEARLHTGAAGS